MISINGLSIEFSTKRLFDNVSFVINDKDKIALVGKNGAGKTTLLKIIKGLQSPTSGTVSISGDTTIGYLPQQMNLSDSVTVIEEVAKAFSHIDELKERLAQINEELSRRTDYESEGYTELIHRMTDLTDRVNMADSDNSVAEMEKTLMGLGFVRSDFGRPTSEFSGGWRMRIELAKILLQRPDVLLLDEPTNHLDIESIQWLENFLITKAKAVVVISHDRAFIDNVTKRTIEINCGRIYEYAVNYSKYVELRKERIEQQMRAYNNQQKMIADTQDFIERFRYKATKAVQVQSRMKQLAKIELIEVDEVDTTRLNLKFPPAPRSGDYPIIIDNVAKSYGSHQVFSNVNLTLKRGEKIAFVGKNGEGKSTLVKCIMDEIPFDGSLKIGHNVKIGYFAQNQAQLLDGELTVFDTIDRVAVGDIRTKIRDLLGAFMFGGEASDKKVKVLSGGEKTRLAMLRLLLESMNLLILDEPTNHLDMKTKDILKQAIKDFDGTVIVVSHDREFLDGLVDKVYEFGGGKVRECLGGIYEYLEKKKNETLIAEQLSRPDIKKERDKEGSETEKKKQEEHIKTPKLSYAEQREREKALKRAEKKVKDAEISVAAKEDIVAQILKRIESGESSVEVFNEHAQATKNLENEMSLWEIAVMELDELKDRYSQTK